MSVKVGVSDSSSLDYQMQEAADDSNNSLPSENDQQDTSETTLEYSAEDLFNAETALENEVENTEGPIFKSESAFDLVKIIAASIFAEPRIEYCPISYENKFFALNFIEAWRCEKDSGNKYKKLYKVDTNGLQTVEKDLVNFVQGLMFEKDNYTQAVEYAKILYNFGLYSLKILTGLLIKINGYGKNDPFGNPVKVVFGKIGSAFSDRIPNLYALLGINTTDENGNVTVSDKYKDTNMLEMAYVYDRISDLYEEFLNKGDIRIELQEILSLLYGALGCYLLGCVYNLVNANGSTISLFYDSNTLKSGVDTFIDRSLGKLGPEVENKLFSLLYTFYLMTKFYENNTSFKMNDPLFIPVVAIGERIANMDEEFINTKLDISELTQGDLNEYKMNFRAFLTEVSFFKDTAIYISSLMNYDNPSKTSVALGILNIGGYKMSVDNDDSHLSPIDGTLSTSTEVSDFSEKNVEIFYNYFISIFIPSIPYTISPTAFSNLILFAAQFRKIKDYASGRTRELATLGLHQAESFITYLYTTWFKKGIAFKTDDTVKCYSCAVANRILKAKLMIDQQLNLYNQFVLYLSNSNQEVGLGFFLNEINNQYLFVARKLNNEDDIDATVPSSIYLNLKLPDDFGRNIAATDATEFENYVKAYNENKISLIELYFNNIDNELFNAKYINKVLEADYNQETIDKLAEYGKKLDDETVMLDNSVLAKLISGNIDKIIKNEHTDSRFEMYFNAFLKSTAMIFFVRRAFDKLIGNAKDAYIITKPREDDPEVDNIFSMIPQVTSQRTFNFLDRLR